MTTTYRLGIASEALFTFIQKINVELTLFKHGFLDFETGVRALKMYLQDHKLINVDRTYRSDDWMLEVFGDLIPSAFTLYSIHDQYINLINTEGLNTYSVVKKEYPAFDPGSFDETFLKIIIEVNFYSLKRIFDDPYLEDISYPGLPRYNLPAVAIPLSSKEAKRVLLQEREVFMSGNKYFTIS